MEASLVGPAKRNRLLAAFEDVERLPVFVGSRDALFQAVEGNGSGSPSAVAAAIESDPALCAMVLRLANQRDRSGVATVQSALDHVAAAELLELAGSAQTFDVLGGDGLWGSHPERFRLHALAVQQTALGVARETHHPAADRIAVAALLHDIGKLVLIAGYAQAAAGLGAGLPPEERVRLELRMFGLTHPMAGGVLARRWCLPGPLESSIAAHHEEGIAGDPAIVRLADMLVHHAHGVLVSPRSIHTAARLAGVDRHALRRLAGWPGQREVARRVEPSVLSRRELEALRGLAHGKVYKEIAADLGLAVSTVRSHLSRTYDKLGARDRAQAVLIATERGWI
jgi:HD-like signal output (HDOD) protein/DNA-binding CsgD family transcriptional regulator